jgi:hypothetical protein
MIARERTAASTESLWKAKEAARGSEGGSSVMPTAKRAVMLVRLAAKSSAMRVAESMSAAEMRLALGVRLLIAVAQRA